MVEEGLEAKVERFRAGLREIERAVRARTRSEALCCGVTVAQCHAITEIGEAGELTLKELAARLGLDASTLSRTVEGLVREGLAARTPALRDRRAVQIALTGKGRTALDRIQSTWGDICAEMLRGLPPEKSEALVASVALAARTLAGCCPGECGTGGPGGRAQER
ncbi:MAG: winged helix-turn-helix transcriptional regulator [Acidobacteria bacterium]|nr:winged helix-turn-helix transcriptional regulator [Acidobacteriota bacterium]